MAEWALFAFGVILLGLLSVINSWVDTSSDLFAGAIVGALVAGIVVGCVRLRDSAQTYSRRKAEDERFRLLFDRSSDAHVLYDETGILECNMAAVQMLGCETKEQLRMYRPAELSPELQPDGRTSIEKSIEVERRVWEDGYYRFEWVHKRLDGTEFPVEVTITSLELDGKRVSLGLWHDLTDQRIAEEALRESRQKMVLHIEKTPLAVIEWDTDFRVTAWNPAAERIFGWKASYALGKHASFIVPDHAKPHVNAVFQELLSKQGGTRSTNENFTSNGAMIHCEWYNTVLVDANDREIGVASLVEDVTQRKYAQEAVEMAAQEMERQNVQLAAARDEALQSARAKSEFLANMSHEIRTPMNGVIGMTGLLLESRLSEQQRDYVQTIRASGDALLTVINDILDFSKIESGKMHVEITDFNLRDVIEEVGDLLGARAHEKGLEFVCAIPDAFPAELRGDSGRIRQVLTNLAANAIKFTESGEVVVGAEVVRSGKRKVRIRIFVRDTGIGIPLPRQRAIFDSFTQADGSTTRKYGGTGLGLTISRQLTQLMGGKIGVASEHGVGSDFWFELPLERQENSFHPKALDSELLGLHVLAVDDSKTNLRILREQLRSWGCLVSEAMSGAEALEQLQRWGDKDPVSLIVLDMQMPNLDGEQTAAAIKSLPAYAKVPIVLLSSMGNAATSDHFRAKGFAAALNKPTRQSQLFNTLVSVVGTDSVLAAAPNSVHVDPLLPPLAGIRVLLAEDNVVNQKVALRVLENFGATADFVSNGLEAIAAIGSIPYDLVLMDCQMPEMDGYEATVAIRHGERGTNRHIAIVAMTANAMQGDREKCLSSGMDDYLSKPMKPHELLAIALKWTGARKTA